MTDKTTEFQRVKYFPQGYTTVNHKLELNIELQAPDSMCLKTHSAVSLNLQAWFLDKALS